MTENIGTPWRTADIFGADFMFTLNVPVAGSVVIYDCLLKREYRHLFRAVQDG